MYEVPTGAAGLVPPRPKEAAAGDRGRPMSKKSSGAGNHRRRFCAPRGPARRFLSKSKLTMNIPQGD